MSRSEEASAAPNSWLASQDPDPVLSLRPGARSRFLILVDHAGRALPEILGDLGLSEAQRLSHIAWDIGAWEVAQRLSERLEAEVVGQAFSRLAIDCNRDPSWPSSIAALSEDTLVPGNQALSQKERDSRRRFIFDPYHGFIDAVLEQRAAEGRRTVVIALHSMTPVFLGQERLMPGAVLFGPAPAFARRLLGALRREIGPDVAENAPYALDLTSDYTVPRHAIGRGLAYAEIEMRQDLVRSEAGCALWTDHLAAALLAADEAFAAASAQA